MHAFFYFFVGGRFDNWASSRWSIRQRELKRRAILRWPPYSQTATHRATMTAPVQSITVLSSMITPPTHGSSRCIPRGFVLHARRRHRCIGHTLLCLTLRSPSVSFHLLLVDSFYYLYYTYSEQ